MTKLLIADRDQNERIAIQWLVLSYSLPFEHVILGDSIDDVITTIENEMPEVVFIELDMIPKEKWGIFKKVAKQYVQQIVATTTEATFDRAMQAIEVQAINLLLKPHSPELIKKMFQKCLQTQAVNENLPYKNENLNTQVTYESLFIEKEKVGNYFQLCVLQTENRKALKQLSHFLREYEFHIQPTILPLSDIIVCVFPEDNHVIKQELNRLLLDWNDKYDDPLAIVVHSILNHNLSLHEMYIQSKRALELTFFKGYRQIITIDKIWEWDRIDPFLNPSEQREWIEMLHSEDTKRIKSWMYDQFLNVTEPYPEPGRIRTRLTSILAQVRRFMKTYKLDKKEYEVSYHLIFETILYNPVLYRIVQELLLFIFQLLQWVKAQKNLSKGDAIERGILYIETHFRDRKLNLQMVAQFVDRSPAYFSHLLIKKRGISFSDLVTKFRIKEAKRLLLETEFTIQQVADVIGFSNPNYFSRIFKESTGITPSEYRNQGIDDISQ